MNAHASPRFDAETPVGQIARTMPAAINVFEQLDIEYACNGGQSLRNAADNAGVRCSRVLERLDKVATGSASRNEVTLEQLVRVHLPEHHAAERQRLTALAAALEAEPAKTAVHERLQRLASRLEATIRRHMDREERDLFPAIDRLTSSHIAPPLSIARRIYVEFVEHDTIHDLLLKLREVRLRALLEGYNEKLAASLVELEHETLRHMHVENNILLPMALEAENRLKAVQASR